MPPQLRFYENCREWKDLAYSKVLPVSHQEAKEFYLSQVASVRDFGLPCVRISAASFRALVANEKECTTILACPLRGGDRIECRFLDLWRGLRGSLTRAPTSSWRHLLAMSAPRPAFIL